MKLSFIAHDYVEFRIGGKGYTIELHNDKHHAPIAWNKEVGMIKRASLDTLKKKYKIESTEYEINKPHPLLKGFYKDNDYKIKNYMDWMK